MRHREKAAGFVAFDVADHVVIDRAAFRGEIDPQPRAANEVCWRHICPEVEIKRVFEDHRLAPIASFTIPVVEFLGCEREDDVPYRPIVGVEEIESPDGRNTFIIIRADPRWRVGSAAADKNQQRCDDDDPRQYESRIRGFVDSRPFTPIIQTT